MPNRLIRNTAVLFKSEVTYGVDPVPTGVADAMLVASLNINPFNVTKVNRELIRIYLGASEMLLGARYVEMDIEVELTGSGTVAVAPQWGKSLLACAMAETIVAATRVDYTPVSAAFGSGTIYWHDDGLIHKATGVRGAPTFKMNVDNRPVIAYKFLGLYSTPTAGANPSTTLTAWKKPQLITEANTLDLTFGGTHATGTAPLIASGTPYPSQGIEVSMGVEVNFTALLGGETIDITSREATAKCTLDLTAAQEAAMYAAAEAETLQSVGLSHGTVSNQKVLLWLPSVQITDVQKTEVKGKRMIALDLRCLPTSAGNDEVRIVTSF